MQLAKLMFKWTTSSTETSEYSQILNDVLARFYTDLKTGWELHRVLGTLKTDEALLEWEQQYTKWVERTAEGKELRQKLAVRRPKEKAFRKLHGGLNMLMSNQSDELKERINHRMRSWNHDVAGASRAKDAAIRFVKDAERDLDFCRRQLATLEKEHPDLLESRRLPDSFSKTIGGRLG